MPITFLCVGLGYLKGIAESPVSSADSAEASRSGPSIVIRPHVLLQRD